MVLSVVINGVLALGFIVGLLFSVTDIKSALESPTNLPILAIFDSTLEDHRATTAFFSLLALVAMCAEMGMIASTSRLTWAFARDKGLPFSSFFARVGGELSSCTFVAQCSRDPGQPPIQNSHQRCLAQRLCCNASQPDQYCVFDRFQRHHFADHLSALLIVHAPYRYHDCAPSWTE